MSSQWALPNSPASRAGVAFGPWLVALAGLALMYGPVYWHAAQTIWQTEEHGHGPLVAGMIAWIFWTLRHAIAQAEYRPAPAAGWALFVAGLIVYTLGRAFDISIFEFASQPLVVAGTLLLMRGWAALKAAWFGVLYFIFMVPLPGIFVDAVTGPLKQWISEIVQHVLFAVGYPIAHSGVIITVGQYQLMVADACSGLNSMFSLLALGTLFMYVMRRKGVVHNAIMLASILPIAFLANVVRVILLVLLTYHFGDEAGQGFLHGAAGIALMVIALGILFMEDAVLMTILRRRAPAGRLA
jgi:exosortase B